LAIAIDGMKLATGSMDGTVKLWDALAPGPAASNRAAGRNFQKTGLLVNFHDDGATFLVWL
jgi:hypothetical protein